MPNPLFRPPRHLIKEWPEVFDDLYMNTMPVAYLDTLVLEFVDGRIWEINISDQLGESDPDEVTDKLLTTMQEFKHDIAKIDFKINIDKLKSDIEDSTKDLF
jgi:hypothetical protein